MILLEKVYSKTKETMRTADKLVLVLVMVIIMSIGIIVPAFASGSGDEGSKVSVTSVLGGQQINISQFSGLITDSFNDLMAKTATNPSDRRSVLLGIKNYNKLGNIGNFFGLQSDMLKNKQVSSVFTDGDDVSSKRLDINTVISWYQNDQDAINTSPIIQYIIFGSALNYIGIDEFRDAKSNSDGVRMIVGYAMYIVFMLAYSAAGLMHTVVEFLNETNIFGYFHNYLLNIHSNMALGGNITNGVNIPVASNPNSFLVIVANIYANLVNLRWLVFGLMVVLLVASITVFKSKAMNQAGTTQTRVRKLILRVIIMCIGIPLVGMVYSTLLGVVNASVNENQYRVTDYIFSQFLDYEDWTVTEPGNAFAGLGTFDVEFNSSKQSMIVKQINLMQTGSNSVTYKDGGALDAAKCIYNINKTKYDFITLNYENAGHIEGLYLPTNQNVSNSGVDNAYLNYDNIIAKSKDSTSSIDSDVYHKAYDKARDLILGYARSNIVSADSLNQRFVEAYDTIIYYLYDKLEVADTSGISAGMGYNISTATKFNNDGNLNIPDEDRQALQTMLVQIFNNSASSWQLWSYSKSGSADPYVVDFGKFKISVNSAGPLVNTYYNGVGRAASGLTVSKSGSDSNDKYPVMWSVLNTSKRLRDGGIIQTDGLEVSNSGDSNFTPGVVFEDDNTIICKVRFGGGLKSQTQGMSPLALYNYMHTKFNLGVMDIYTPDQTANSGVSMMRYSVTTPYSGIPETVHLIYTFCILFSIGIIGWVFGISLMLNTIVQMIKAIPMMFKMAIGSIQGFVETLLTVLSIIAELLITMLLYTLSVQIISFIIALFDSIFRNIIDVFVNMQDDTMNMISNLLSMAVIFWGTFELIKWRQAITMSVKSLFTHMLNQVFGTSAAMPSGASNGMLKAAALGGAAALTAGALADQGTLDDVINDMTQSDLGSELSDKMQNGDYTGAWNDIKDYANGDYDGDTRGGSEADREAMSRGLRPAYDENGDRLRDEETGELMYQDADGNKYTKSEMEDMPNAYQDLTEDQQATIDNLDKQIDAARADGDEDKAQELEKKRAEAVAGFRSDNYQKAKEAGVSDWATYEKSLSDSESGESGSGYMPESIDAATGLTKDGSKELKGDAKEAYEAARLGGTEGAQKLQNLGDKYNNHGLTSDQVDEIDEMIANGASESDVAAAVDNFAQSNFGDDYKQVIDKLNEANGRSGSATYGTNDNSDGKARTVHVSKQTSENGAVTYGVTDSNSGNGEQTISVIEDGAGGVTYANANNASDFVQTVDMGNVKIADGAEAYAGTYNSAAMLYRSSGVDVTNANLGAGSANQITVSEVSRASSMIQMGNAGLKVDTSQFGGNNSFEQVSASIVTTTLGADYNAAVSGSGTAPTHMNYTPLTIDATTAENMGIGSYNLGYTTEGAPQLVATQTGGNDVSPNVIRLQYTNASGGTNYVTAPTATSDNLTTGFVNTPNGNGELKMEQKTEDFLKNIAYAKVASDIIDKALGSDSEEQ